MKMKMKMKMKKRGTWSEKGFLEGKRKTMNPNQPIEMRS